MKVEASPEIARAHRLSGRYFFNNEISTCQNGGRRRQVPFMPNIFRSFPAPISGLNTAKSLASYRIRPAGVAGLMRSLFGKRNDIGCPAIPFKTGRLPFGCRNKRVRRHLICLLFAFVLFGVVRQIVEASFDVVLFQVQCDMGQFVKKGKPEIIESIMSKREGD